MKKSLVALAFGTLALGIAEFVMMGILPDVSRYFDVSIPTAGHCISAYALGVCCGAPLLVAFHKYPLKRLLLFLAGLILFGAALSTMAQSFVMLVVARFISGLPHGAPWLILAATMLGNGGIFCWYSYVSPLLTSVGGFPHEALSALMIAAGFGMVAGNLISGRLCDRHRPGHVAAVTQTITIATLLLIFLLAGYGWISAALMVVCTGCLFALSSPQQFLILKHAPGGELLGGAAIQVAFNLGNAIGAFCGGLPMEHGATPRWSALVGVPFVVMGLVAFICFCRKYERRNVAVD